VQQIPRLLFRESEKNQKKAKGKKLRGLSMLDIKQISIHPSADLKMKPQDELMLPFGRHFTDHMFLMNYSLEREWYNPRIVPYGVLPLDPAASSLHYGQAVWEGMKAYRTSGGDIQLFRPRENFLRLNRSAARLVMPALDPDFVVDALKQLLRIDQEWVPHLKGTSIYIRPIMIAIEPFLGVHPATEMLFYIILSPVGPYFTKGFSPIKLYVENQYVRASEGGVGNSKNSGNYAASLMAATEAKKKGFDQVLWLDGKEHRWIEEIGTMNVFFKIDDHIITPPLGDSILPGITRDSVIKLFKSIGISVIERKISIDEIIEGIKTGKVTECFGTGTACVIAPVNLLQYKENSFQIGNGEIGSLTNWVYTTLTGIQYGEKDDPFKWIEKI
jgi:branched-chain amino acid aminotransferase